jgi:GNAT superfamily N-acetyltransferase
VSLTAQGRAERALLDERSDQLARSMVEPLDSAQRERLVAAMATVTNLLTAAAVELGVLDPEEPHARYCLAEYYAEINRRFPSGFDPAEALPADPDSFRPPRGIFVVATLHSEAVGCGGLKLHADRVAEVKRLWVSSTVRGLGLGRRLLGDLERRAREHGSETIRLDTNASLTEAIAMYGSAGYRQVPPYNAEPYADYWFEKRLYGALDGV